MSLAKQMKRIPHYVPGLGVQGFILTGALFTHVEKPSSKSNLTISFPKAVLNLSGYPNFKTAIKKCLHESLSEATLPV